MQDFNLPGSLGSRNAQISTGVVASTATSNSAPANGSPILVPISVSTVGQQVKVTDLSNKLVATGPFSDAITQANTAALSQKAQSVVLFSQRKTLFDAIISAEQQKVILAATSKQPNIAKLSLVDTQQITLRNAVISTISQQSVALNLTPPLGELDHVKLDVKNLPTGLKAGQQVQVQLQQVGNQWVAKLIVPKLSSDSVQNQQDIQLQGKSSSQRKTLVNQEAALNNTRGAAPSISVESPVSNRDPLVQAVIKSILQTGINLGQAPKLVESLTAVLSKTASTTRLAADDGAKTTSSKNPANHQANAQPVVAKILQQSPNLSTLQLAPTGKMIIASQLPVAQLPINQVITPSQQQADTRSLQNLPTVIERNAERFFALPDTSRNQLLHVLKSLPITKTTATQPDAPISSAASNDKVTVKGIESKEVSSAVNADKPPAVPKAFVEQLSVLIRQHFVNATPHKESVLGLSQVMTQIGQSNDTGIRDLGKQIQQALLPLLSKKEPDPAQIQALLQMPAMPISTSSLLQIAPINNMVSGLVALLQISLATRLPQRQTTTSEKLGSALTQLIQTATAATGSSAKQPVNLPTNNARVLQEFTQVEQRNQLLRTLSKTLSNHHYSKLTSAEAALQGTDSLYYSLPSYNNNSQRDIELLVKRETESNKTKNEKPEQTSTWHLTMLMDIGEIGEMLSKCKLKERELTLDIYTSTEALKIHVMDMLPILNKRLSKFGLDIISSQCQLGKMPEALRPKPYQLLHTQA